MKNGLMKYFLLFAISLVLTLIINPISARNISVLTMSWLELTSIIYFLVYSLFTVLVLRKYSGSLQAKYIIIAISLGAIFIELIARISEISIGEFRNLVITLPDLLIRIYAILIGYLVFKVSKVFWKVMIFITALLLSLWLSLWGYDCLNNKCDYEAYRVKTEKSDSTMINIEDIESSLGKLN